MFRKSLFITFVVALSSWSVVASAGMVNFGVMGEYGLGMTKLKDTNDQFVGSGLEGFNTTQKVMQGRAYFQFMNRLIIGAQVTPYSISNGGQSFGITGFSNEYVFKETPLYAIVGVNVLPPGPWQLNLVFGYGFTLKNELDQNASFNGNTDTAVFTGASSHPIFGSVELFYMFAQNHLGIGVTGQYTKFTVDSYSYNSSASTQTNGFIAGTPASGSPLQDSGGNNIKADFSGLTGSIALRLQI
jgi:hypothetical protein